MKSLNIPETNLKRVVIIGAGFGGLEVVKKLSSKHYQIVLIDKNNYHTFQPLLYQVATAGLEPDSIAYPIRKIFKSKKNFYFRNTVAQNVDTEKKELHTEDGILKFDVLVIATGSTSNYFGNKRIEQLAMPMKSVPEALNLRSLFLENFEASLLTSDLTEREKLMNYVIVGGGPTGVELAGAMAELKNHVLPNDYPDLDIRRMRILLLEGGDSLLKAMNKKAGSQAEEYLQKLGVEVWLNTFVNDYDGDTVTTNNKSLPAKTLIWAAGVTGNLLEGIPKESIDRGRILVNDTNLIDGTNSIYAIGDIALMNSVGPMGDPMVAQTAIQHGTNLAYNLNALAQGKSPRPFIYNDKGSMATIGRNRAVAEIGQIKLKGILAWSTWMFVHLITLVGFRNKMVALLNWVQSYFTYDKGIRLIIRPFKKSKNVHDNLPPHS
ncbi:MAG: NAD(P)/FAD-dependent oxidoreductase [Schleiferiaceae bacterium]|nr:NAD(P)/FAD-dependent oxidoreductase [Schleiferiaceae bacterium]